MPAYNISVVIDPSGSSAGARVVEGNLARIAQRSQSVKTSVQRAFDFYTQPAVQKISAVDKALDEVAASARTAGNTIDNALSKSAAAAQRNAGRMVNSAAQVRASQLQLGQQFNDFSTQVLAGGSVVTAFAQQSGQAAFALQGMNGALGSVGRFLAGPWGTILIIATTLLAGLVTKILAKGDALKEAIKDLREDARETEINRQAQQIFANTLEGVTAALRENKQALKELEDQGKSAARQALENAIEQRNRLRGIRAETLALLANARALYEVQQARASGPGQRGEIAALGLTDRLSAIDRLEQSLSNVDQQVAEADRQIQEALSRRVTELADSSAEERIERHYERLIEAARRRAVAEGTVSTTLNEQIRLLRAQREEEQRRAREQERAANSSTRTPQRVFQDFERELRERGIRRAAGRTGYRSARDQNEIFRAGESPLDGYRRLSRHQSYQALDPTRASHNDQAAREAAQAAGLRGFRIVRESGGRFHYEWTGAGRAGQADVSGSERMAQREQTERERLERAAEQQRDFIQGVVDQAEARGRGSGQGGVRAQIDRTLADFQRRFNRGANDNERQRITEALTAAESRETAERFNEAYVQPLERLQELQGKTGLERQILNTQLEETQRIGRDLLPTERDMIENSVRQSDALERQNGILSELQQPLQDYQDRLTALNALLEKGSISQVQYNAQVANLGSTARSLIADLPGRDPMSGRSYSEIAARSNEDARYANELAAYETNQQQLLALGISYQGLREAAYRRHVDNLNAIDQARKTVALSAAQSTFESLAQITEAGLGQQNAIYKAMFIASKAFAIAQSVIAIQQGIAEALKLPFPANLAAAATVAAQAASIISNIQAVALNLADGGYVSGPGTSRSDSIPANLSNGEFVVNAEATRANRAMLEAINSGRRPPVTAANDTYGGSDSGDNLTINVGDINVQGGNGSPREIGHEVKAAITSIVRSELKTQKRDGGSLTQTPQSVMTGT